MAVGHPEARQASPAVPGSAGVLAKPAAHGPEGGGPSCDCSPLVSTPGVLQEEFNLFLVHLHLTCHRILSEEPFGAQENSGAFEASIHLCVRACNF